MSFREFREDEIEYIQGIPFLSVKSGDEKHLTPVFFPGNTFFYLRNVRVSDSLYYVNRFVFTNELRKKRENADKAVRNHLQVWAETNISSEEKRKYILEQKKEDIAILWATKSIKKLIYKMIFNSKTLNDAAVYFNDKRIHEEISSFVSFCYKFIERAVYSKKMSEHTANTILARIFATIKKFLNNEKLSVLNEASINKRLFNVCLLSQKTPEEVYKHFPLLEKYSKGGKVKFLSHILDTYIQGKFDQVRRRTEHLENLSESSDFENIIDSFFDLMFLKEEELSELNSFIDRMQVYKRKDAVNIHLAKYTGKAQKGFQFKNCDASFLASLAEHRIGFMRKIPRIYEPHMVHDTIEHTTRYHGIPLLIMFISFYRAWFDEDLINRFDLAMNDFMFEASKKEDADLLNLYLSIDTVFDFINFNRRDGHSPLSIALIRLLGMHAGIKGSVHEIREVIYQRNRKWLNSVKEVDKALTLALMLEDFMPSWGEIKNKIRSSGASKALNFHAMSAFQQVMHESRHRGFITQSFSNVLEGLNEPLLLGFKKAPVNDFLNTKIDNIARVFNMK